MLDERRSVTDPTETLGRLTRRLAQIAREVNLDLGFAWRLDRLHAESGYLIPALNDQPAVEACNALDRDNTPDRSPWEWRRQIHQISWQEPSILGALVDARHFALGGQCRACA